MSDRYLEFSNSPLGRQLTGMLGLPSPPRLVRARGGFEALPLAGKPVLIGSGTASTAASALIMALKAAGAELYVVPSHGGLGPVKEGAAEVGAALKTEPGDNGPGMYALVFDATGVADLAGLRLLYDFMQPHVRSLQRNGRVLVVGLSPAAAPSPRAHAVAAGLRGFIKALGKEIGGKGATANLLEVARGGEGALAGALRFFLSEHSAFVSGQSLTLDAPAQLADPAAFVMPLAGKTALVTGAARGIGAAIAETLHREGAEVIGVDRPQEEQVLAETMGQIGGRCLLLDVTAVDAGDRIVQESGGLDIVVHNAGVTRDKMLRNMTPEQWDMVLNINLGAIFSITDRLMQSGLNRGARLVCISSIGGISGNAGQTNYATTKASIIGFCEAMAPEMARLGGSINAVAPGFIETQMTAAMPSVPREVGRRLSSLAQGGLPIDIAEAVTFLASPLAAGVNGRTLRVCGQNFMGA